MRFLPKCCKYKWLLIEIFFIKERFARNLNRAALVEELVKGLCGTNTELTQIVYALLYRHFCLFIPRLICCTEVSSFTNLQLICWTLEIQLI